MRCLPSLLGSQAEQPSQPHPQPPDLRVLNVLYPAKAMMANMIMETITVDIKSHRHFLFYGADLLAGREIGLPDQQVNQQGK